MLFAGRFGMEVLTTPQIQHFRLDWFWPLLCRLRVDQIQALEEVRSEEPTSVPTDRR